MAPEMVRVKNTSGEVFADGWAGITYQLHPGDQTIVPWGAAVNWLGDPYVIDKPTLARFDRQDEVVRVEALYGCYDDDKMTRRERWEKNRPHLFVETLDGDEITMLCEDLNGSGQLPELSTERPDEKVALASELERMKQVQAQLLDRLHQLESGQESYAELPTDTPTKVPVDEEADDPIDPSQFTVTEVLEYVEQHPDELNDVLEAETEGNQRSTLIHQLEARQEGTADVSEVGDIGTENPYPGYEMTSEGGWTGMGENPEETSDEPLDVGEGYTFDGQAWVGTGDPTA